MTAENTALLNEKKDHFLTMLNRLDKWDQLADSAQDIIDQNQVSIGAITAIDEVLTRDERKAFTEANRGLVEQVLSIQKRLLASLQKEYNKVEGQMKQMNQKNKVVSHYMNKDTSLFVDRDV